MWAWTLLAQAVPGKRDPFREPEVIWGTVGLIVALLMGAFLFWVVDRWRKKTMVATSDAKKELTDFRAMYERGEITEAEYIRLRDRVAVRVKQAPVAPPSAARPDAATGPTGPSGPTAPSPPSPPPPPPAASGDWEGSSI